MEQKDPTERRSKASVGLKDTCFPAKRIAPLGCIHVSQITESFAAAIHAQGTAKRSGAVPQQL
jgi:hypothetical protein